MSEEKTAKSFFFPIGKNLTVVLVALLLVAAFIIGSLYTKVQLLEKGSTSTSAKPTLSIGAEAPTFGSAEQVEKLKKEDHVRGDRTARVLLIEYSDFECPFCKRFHPTAQQVVGEYKGKVAWVYRHFPLDQLHSKADKEAEATECAAEFGGNDGFWEMADKIFEVTPSNNGLDLEMLPDLAAKIGLDKNKFKTCLDSGKYAKYVEEDYQSGTKAGVSGTPGNILLDTKTGKTRFIPGAVPFEQLKQVIDQLLSES